MLDGIDLNGPSQAASQTAARKNQARNRHGGGCEVRLDLVFARAGEKGT
jgi:hypothetical protein